MRPSIPPLALIINASVLILAAASFNNAGKIDVVELEQVHSFLALLLDFGVRSDAVRHRPVVLRPESTVTATLAGQIVMEGFINIRLAPWLRRLVTPILAIGARPSSPLVRRETHRAVADPESDDHRSSCHSQIILLVMFTASKAKMGEFVALAG